MTFQVRPPQEIYNAKLRINIKRAKREQLVKAGYTFEQACVIVSALEKQNELY